MAQRSVEVVVGKLATDEQLRTAFQQNPSGTLSRLVGSGIVLTPTEQAALLATPAETWDAIAAALDSRLQKIALPQDEPVA